MDLLKKVLAARDTSPAPHFAVFDFDGTVIVNDCAEAALAYMVRHAYPGARNDFGLYYSLLDSHETSAAYRFGAQTLRKLTPRAVDAIVRSAMEEEGTEIGTAELLGRTIAKGIRLRENVVRLMRQLQTEKVDAWIVSASPELVVRSAMDYFGLGAKAIGVRNILDEDIITGDSLEPLSIYEGKVACIQRYIHPTAKPLLGIGDSMNDFAMLAYAQVRAVVDRGNRLAETAREHDWHLL